MTPRRQWWLAGVLIAGSLLGLADWTLRRQRDSTQAIEVDAQQRESALAMSGLRERASVAAAMLAEALVNPTYFFDLQRIGEVLVSSGKRDDVAYVLLIDAKGNILHDGSADIAQFGEKPNDRFAVDAAATLVPHAFIDADFVEVAHPLFLGDQRLATLRLALRRKNAATLPPTMISSASRDDTWLLSGLFAAFAVLLWLGDRRFVAPQAQTNARLAQIARVYRQGDMHANPTSDPGEAMDAIVKRFAGFDGELRQQSLIDGLTGLPNRIALRAHIDTWIKQTRSATDEFALLFIDLDDFKRINDTLGHDIGDDILTGIARRFAEIVREEHPGDDGFIARFGGDEFVLLIAGADVRRRAGVLAELLLATLRIPLQAGGQILHVSASVGITSYPEDATDAARLLKNGDIAMYLAKVQGRNCVRFFNNYLTRLADDRLEIEQDLRAAVDNDELKLHYQPIVDLGSGLIHGAEALLRWHHPTRGLVPSALFVGIAEDVGMIDALGDFALRTACETAVRWPLSDGRKPFVAVNVSVRQLRDARFPARVAQVLRESGLAASELHLELTESSLLDSESIATEMLSELHRLGVKIWLDDFGTGFSGLNHLRQVPVDGVKIDRSFTADLLTDRHDAALTSAIIAMARSLDITVVAEGVESSALCETLTQLACPYGQGFWLGEPAHSEKMVERIVAQRYGDRDKARA